MCSQQHKHSKQWEEEEKTRKKSVAWEQEEGRVVNVDEYGGNGSVRMLYDVRRANTFPLCEAQASQHHIFHPQQHHLIRLYTFFPFFHCCLLFSLSRWLRRNSLFFFAREWAADVGHKRWSFLWCATNSQFIHDEDGKRRTRENRREKSMRNREVRWSSATMSRVGKAAYSRNLC